MTPYYFNDYLIAGNDLSAIDSSNNVEFENLLNELGLVRQVKNSGNNTLVIFRKKKEEEFSTSNSQVLQRLRQRYGDVFGPVVLNSNYTLRGALLNELIVKFTSDTDQNEAEAYFAKFGATQVYYQVHQSAYKVVFPDSWGYKIVDVGKEIFDHERISYVENVLYAVPVR